MPRHPFNDTHICSDPPEEIQDETTDLHDDSLCSCGAFDCEHNDGIAPEPDVLVLSERTRVIHLHEEDRMENGHHPTCDCSKCHLERYGSPDDEPFEPGEPFAPSPDDPEDYQRANDFLADFEPLFPGEEP